MEDREKDTQEAYSSMVNHNTILLSFEGWIKYIEGFSRGLQTTKTVDAGSVMECVGEIMEYMKTLRGDILDILQYCEDIMDKNEVLEARLLKLEPQPQLPVLIEPEVIEEENEDTDGKM